MNSILEWLWSWLPDRCEVAGCSRQGVRGNENVIDGRIVCDDCHARMLDVSHMRAFGASHAACSKWPDDTAEHRALRAAYCQGAADYGGKPCHD